MDLNEIVYTNQNEEPKLGKPYERKKFVNNSMANNNTMDTSKSLVTSSNNLFILASINENNIHLIKESCIITKNIEIFKKILLGLNMLGFVNIN